MSGIAPVAPASMSRYQGGLGEAVCDDRALDAAEKAAAENQAERDQAAPYFTLQDLLRIIRDQRASLPGGRRTPS
jgi:hypothetical protein